MKFTFEETEIINQLGENKQSISKQGFIEKLIAIHKDDDGIIQSTINKIGKMSESQFNIMLSNLPINVFEKY